MTPGFVKAYFIPIAKYLGWDGSLLKAYPPFLDLGFGMLPQQMALHSKMHFSSQLPSEKTKFCDSCFAKRHQKARGYSSTAFEARLKLGVKPKTFYLGEDGAFFSSECVFVHVICSGLLCVAGVHLHQTLPPCLLRGHKHSRDG